MIGQTTCMAIKDKAQQPRSGPHSFDKLRVFIQPQLVTDSINGCLPLFDGIFMAAHTVFMSSMLLTSSLRELLLHGSPDLTISPQAASPRYPISQRRGTLL